VGGGGGGCRCGVDANELGGPGGAGGCELPVSREVHPAFLNAGAEVVLQDADAGGGGAEFEVDEEMNA